MRVTNLNLEDRRGWLKFRHILTSFVSDYIDLVAPEQTDVRLHDQVLTIAFSFVDGSANPVAVNQFTQNLEGWLGRLRLLGVRRIELEFYSPEEAAPIFARGMDIEYISASALSTAVESGGAVQSTDRRSRGLVRRLRNWLLSPENLAGAHTAGRLAVRDPKGFLNSARVLVVSSFVQAIDWVDTFPWEEKFNSGVQWQKRRHQRNLAKALFEDSVILLVLAMAVLWVINFFAAPTLDVSVMPPQHYDRTMDAPRYRCSFPGVSLENYVCLHRGMSYEQVASIFGGEGTPLSVDYQFSDASLNVEEMRQKLERGEAIDYRKQPIVISWQSGNMVINTTFINNELVARGYRKLS